MKFIKGKRCAQDSKGTTEGTPLYDSVKLIKEKRCAADSKGTTEGTPLCDSMKFIKGKRAPWTAKERQKVRGLMTLIKQYVSWGKSCITDSNGTAEIQGLLTKYDSKSKRVCTTGQQRSDRRYMVMTTGKCIIRKP